MSRLAIAASSLLALAALPTVGHAQADLRDAASLRFDSGFAGPPARTWPTDAPPVRFYFGPGASAPSCGLLVASGRQVVSLVEPDEGSDFPQCIGVPAAMVLRQGQQRFLLLRVKQKDTREDISLNDMLLLDAGGVPQARDDLSATTAPDATQPLTQVAAWLRARWANQAEAEQGARALQEHTATTPGGYLAVSQQPGGQCQFSVGTPEGPAPSLKVGHPCERVVATSAFQQGAASWFLVVLQVHGAGAQALVFESDAKGAREVPELASALKTKAADGKILPLRQALQKLVRKARS
ncbi:hypothetical protein [Roseateles amylovorans]|uniref:Uncharacterized protein n=1 Tax=Roseateles amylovorans TaxID=2978473 RepID=A0ABY6BA46_9BURK|nr:hypothetical protein [Roseateles amylovorans]UXH80107.1 hypothetical protein N4261_09580 [Roseateles amylovorans]